MYIIEDELDLIVRKKTNLSMISNPTDDDIHSVLTEKLGIKSQDLLVVIEELIINAKEHGSKPVQFYFGKQLESFVFAIEDFGVGIHETLPRNIRLGDTKGKSSTAIMRLSLEEGLTGTGVVGRGMGLYYLSKLIKEKNGECLVSCNSGIVIQKQGYFFERTIEGDIQRNIVILQLRSAAVGL